MWRSIIPQTHEHKYIINHKPLSTLSKLNIKFQQLLLIANCGKCVCVSTSILDIFPCFNVPNQQLFDKNNFRTDEERYVYQIRAEQPPSLHGHYALCTLLVSVHSTYTIHTHHSYMSFSHKIFLRFDVSHLILESIRLKPSISLVGNWHKCTTIVSWYRIQYSNRWITL